MQAAENAVTKAAHSLKETGKAITGTGGDPKHAEPEAPLPAQEQKWPGEESKMDPAPDYGYDTYKGSGKLQDKVALITGADSGIGRAVALAFAREGADVAVGYYNEHEDANVTKKVVEEAGRQCILLPGDISEEVMCKGIVQQTVDKFGRIDVLILNAAYQGDVIDDITELSHDRILRTFQTNIVAMFDIVKAAKPHMPKGSSIVTSSSINAYQPMPELIDYSTTKGAIVAFTKALANKLLAADGIRVNSVAPGPVWTPLIPESMPSKMVASFGKGMTPIDRPAQPKELAPAYVFLASNETASYINGEILAVTGGMLTA